MYFREGFFNFNILAYFNMSVYLEFPISIYLYFFSNTGKIMPYYIDNEAKLFKRKNKSFKKNHLETFKNLNILILNY